MLLALTLAAWTINPEPITIADLHRFRGAIDSDNKTSHSARMVDYVAHLRDQWWNQPGREGFYQQELEHAEQCKQAWSHLMMAEMHFRNRTNWVEWQEGCLSYLELLRSNIGIDNYRRGIMPSCPEGALHRRVDARPELLPMPRN